MIGRIALGARGRGGSGRRGRVDHRATTHRTRRPTHVRPHRPRRRARRRRRPDRARPHRPDHRRRHLQPLVRARRLGTALRRGRRSRTQLASPAGSRAPHPASPRRPVIAPRGAASTTPPQPTPDSTHATSPSRPPQDHARPGASTATPRPGRSTSTASAAPAPAPSAASSPQPNSATPPSSSATATPQKGRASAPADQPSATPRRADVDEAIGYAVRRGAQQIVLFGWSMGAAIALQLADRPATRGTDRRARTRLTSPRLDRSHQDQLRPQRTARSSRAPRDPVAHPRPAGSHSRPAGPHPAPLLRLDRPSRRPHHADPDPPRHQRRLRADPALTSTPRRPPGPRRAGDLRRRPHPLPGTPTPTGGRTQ